ncbi:Maf family nucleotide pyrophosphatase [Methanohalophilus halophilus]|uniref:dTTP/UTP pyrophosphatase n=1 Tax=Methanohalophilus halophilus TaxID=2177 RepID=A0A1L3Q2E1_9EURY|nr:Maf family nucleotide pyrophosphatase [Methanohalophilus halophilus]APH39029.1 septum formation protein Maf [Methanohalophilus halophilus]RNI09915.1 septum formation protein Maf [Methanohalophilus halophilus]SDW90841.1 septum formation protein [Methanohalophilus halophilus]
MRRIILASSSPRRRELLKQLIGDNFEIIPSVYNEIMIEGLDSASQALQHALGKGRDVAAKYPDSVIIAADTVVLCDGKLLGKPACKEDAMSMLEMINRRAVAVLTGIVVIDSGKGIENTDIVSTQVRMANISRKEITAYLKTGEPMGKAGAFAIQGFGAVLVEKVEGDFFNVVGLPLFRLSQMLKNIGVDVFELMQADS